MTDAKTIAADLRALLPRAHAPYSGVQVACAVESADGRVHEGVNVENAAYPQGWCAEASAIGAAVTAGPTKIVRVFVASSLPGHVWPCGGCRQKIFELAAPGCEVVSLAGDGTPERRTIEELLPLAFRLDPRQVRGG
ncbi:MAG: cytidine deaminase [Proteobacteria bacterium]|nr:cytidine deaminase [Pseudomonadota bacterium]